MPHPAQSGALCGVHALNTLLQVRRGAASHAGLHTPLQSMPSAVHLQWGAQAPTARLLPCTPSRAPLPAPPCRRLQTVAAGHPRRRAAAALAQGQYFSELDLASIARELDQLEREMLGGGALAEHGNLDDSGMFSSQARGAFGLQRPAVGRTVEGRDVPCDGWRHGRGGHLAQPRPPARWAGEDPHLARVLLLNHPRTAPLPGAGQGSGAVEPPDAALRQPGDPVGARV
jgi:hypothetical protein